MPTLTWSSINRKTSNLNDAVDCWRGNWRRMLVCKNSPKSPATPFLPERVKWIRVCFHPCLLSLIQKPITSDFPLQERDCELQRYIYKKRGMTDEVGEKKHKDNPSWTWFYIEMPVRKKHFCALLFPRSMYSAAWMTKLHDEISPSQTLYCAATSLSKLNSSVIEHSTLIVSPLKMHMLSFHPVSQGELLFTVRHLRIHFTCAGMISLEWSCLQTHRSSSCRVFVILYLQNRQKSMLHYVWRQE